MCDNACYYYEHMQELLRTLHLVGYGLQIRGTSLFVVITRKWSASLPACKCHCIIHCEALKHLKNYRSQHKGRLSDFNNFWYNYFRHNLPPNGSSSFHLIQHMLLHYLGILKNTKSALKWTKKAKNHPWHYW